MASYSKYLCKACYNIPISLFCEPIDEKQLFLHHDSVKNLQASAESGDCKLCSLLYSAVDPTRKPGQHRYGQPGDSLGQNMGHGTFLRVAISREDYSRGRPRLIMSIGELGPEFVFDIEYSDNPLSSCFYPESQLDQSAFSLASSWIHKCVSSHDTCQRLYDVSFKPTRLIDVGQSGLHPRLINTKEHNPEDLQYVALSHCWGPPGSMPEAAKTSDVSLPTRLKKIPIQTLPRTFRDAIIVTRKLGCRYLWIDSLCIIQNSATDWQRESSEMGKVYSHSFCTIAPAASSDCHGGFFPELRKLPILSARRHSITSIRPSEPLAVLIKRPQDWDGLFVQSPLNSRGWTLQERELSPRVLYFTKHTLLYECKEARASENEPFALKSTLDRKIEDDRVGRSLRCLDTVVTDEYATRHFEHSMSWHYDKWMLLVEDYITKELTNPSDRFPALSGLASEFSYLLNDNYVAGLWEKDLLRGLCWQYSNRRDTKDQKIMKQTINYGPTWSWAKMVLPITYDLVRRKSSHIQQHPTSSKNTSRNWKEPQIQRIGITPEGADPNGTLLSAQIQLLGQLKHLKRSKSGDYDIDGRPLVISWDSLPQSPSQIYILSLGSLEIGLILVASERVDGEYLRIGLLQEIDWRWFRDLEVRVLTLV